MAYLYEDELRQKAERLVQVLTEAGIEASSVPGSFRDYTVKVSVGRSGRNFGNVNLYYSPKKDLFSLKTNELRDQGIVPELEAYWERLDQSEASVLTPASGAPGCQAYVDGSYLDGGIGYGVVILQQGKAVAELSGPVEDGALQGMRQVGGELQAVYKAVKWCQANDVHDVSIYYDYEGIEKWATGAWRGNNPATQAYAAQMSNPPIEIHWQKVRSHSGDRWNERADELAKQGARPATPGLEAEQVQDPLAALSARVEGFVQVLKQHGVNSAYQGILNNQFARVAIAPSGYVDVYNTRRRPPSQPYLHGFRGRSLQRTVEGLWREYYEGRPREDEDGAAWLEEAIHYYEILKPYRDCAFDFGHLALALDRAYRHLRRPGFDVESSRYDFDQLEIIYGTLREEAEDHERHRRQETAGFGVTKTGQVSRGGSPLPRAVAGTPGSV
jgi:ribonuclease HI